jgi:hypothetical protein
MRTTDTYFGGIKGLAFNEAGIERYTSFMEAHPAEMDDLTSRVSSLENAGARGWVSGVRQMGNDYHSLFSDNDIALTYLFMFMDTQGTIGQEESVPAMAAVMVADTQDKRVQERGTLRGVVANAWNAERDFSASMDYVGRHRSTRPLTEFRMGRYLDILLENQDRILKMADELSSMIGTNPRKDVAVMGRFMDRHNGFISENRIEYEELFNAMIKYEVFNMMEAQVVLAAVKTCKTQGARLMVDRKKGAIMNEKNLKKDYRRAEEDAEMQTVAYLDGDLQNHMDRVTRNLRQAFGIPEGFYPDKVVPISAGRQ